ncbi:MAG: FAD-dependent oxidoreductase [Sporolactobacillus sp.]
MYDVIIIGAGPAGQSAAIFTARAGLSTLVLDNEKGLTRRALLKNHYGLIEASGNTLIAAGKQQVDAAGAIIKKAHVTGITKEANCLTITDDDGNTYTAHQIILATGANAALAKAVGLQIKDGREKYVNTIIAADSEGHTSVDGIWAAGVAAGVSVHTIVTSGDGAKTAINLISELKGERYTDHEAVSAK